MLLGFQQGRLRILVVESLYLGRKAIDEKLTFLFIKSILR